MDKVVVAYSTAPDSDTAQKIARSLVEQKLAACVSMTPGLLSIYRWQGVVEEAKEVGLTIKTTQSRVAALSAALQTLHPYEVPELIVAQVTNGLPAYLQWVR
ncbi:MAG: divalent-cation tolerance protein CutA, partial [Burkholderiaceae bacterium]|nr:divalent-cation tolerance protein CutA [Burkholderiaceae bacterium]